MVATFGHLFLLLALLFSFAQAILPQYIASPKAAKTVLPLSTFFARLILICTSLSFLSLIYTFVISDFSVLSVFKNSHSSKPLLYKIAGTWGNHEGSMLLWVWVLSIFGSAISFQKTLPAAIKLYTLAFQGGLGFLFMLFTLMTSNPFQLIHGTTPLDGQGLNPLLQDPALAFHPPFLYVGYVGFSIVFALAAAGLLTDNIGRKWATYTRPWVLSAWGFLTVGILLGSYWAYYELGWGGWWFWDPVENASLMPWLAGTALLHSILVLEKRNLLKKWVVFLSLLAFSLSILGTFLVRSGVLVSVHSFASDPSRGIFILLLFTLIVGGGLFLLSQKSSQLTSSGWFDIFSRESAIVFNNLILSVALTTVFLGTLYPVFTDAFGGALISVGPPYFSRTFIPLMIPFMMVVGLVPTLSWRRGQKIVETATLPALISLFVFVTLIQLYPHQSIYGLFGVSLGIWIVAGTWISIRKFNAMAVAHIGFGIMVIGMVASTIGQIERITLMHPGDTQQIYTYTLTLNKVVAGEGPNYLSQRAILNVNDTFQMIPEKRAYPVAGTTTSEAAIHTTILGDLYASFGGADNFEQKWILRLYFKPLVSWIWVGGLLMALGAFMRLLQSRIKSS